MSTSQKESISNPPEILDPQVEYEELKGICAEYMDSEDMDTRDEA